MSHGYYKDLLNILALAATDQLTHPHVSFDFLSSPRPDHSAQAGRKAARRRKAAQKVKATDREEIGKEKTAEKTAQRVAETQKVASEKAKQERADSTKAAHERLSARLKDDMRFRALFIAVARIFAKSLAADVKVLQKIADDSTPKEEKEELKWHVTLAGKWAPTLGASHDSLTNIATAISLVLYASGDMENLKLPNHQLDQALTAADADRLRSFYRRWIISPLRRQALIPEVSMSVNEWDKVRAALYLRILYGSLSLCFLLGQLFSCSFLILRSQQEAILQARRGPSQILPFRRSQRQKDNQRRDSRSSRAHLRSHQAPNTQPRPTRRAHRRDQHDHHQRTVEHHGGASPGGRNP